jgi:ABC-type transport system involved in cytochrome c biogenesis permease subunit
MTAGATEVPWLWAGLGAYAVATALVFRSVGRLSAAGVAPLQPLRSREHLILLCIVCGVVLLATGLGVRWERLGHGPFVNLFELLMSQLFSLGLIYSVIYWRVQGLRTSAVVVLPLIWLLGIWILLLDPADSQFPPTYHNPWLWAHVGFGKVFLSFCLVAAGLAGVILLRRIPRLGRAFAHMSDAALDQLAWRFMMLTLVFDSLMLIAGAVWAQDAWGRYWSWDALETSAFMTWLSIGFGIHVRLSYKIPIPVAALVILAIFGLAFATYFGAPFYSEAAHKGVI